MEDTITVLFTKSEFDNLLALIDREAGLCQPARGEDEERRSGIVNSLRSALNRSLAYKSIGLL